MSYQPIENYGIIGDTHTVALVGVDGSIDWMCYPHFDSPSVFGALLDAGKGGRFSIASTSRNARPKQLYWPETNVLVTRFLCPDGVGQIVDYMPAGSDGGLHWLVRNVQVVRGEMGFRVDCRPAFDYGRGEHDTRLGDSGACFDGPGFSLGLATEVPLAVDGTGAVGEFTLSEGESATFVLREVEAGADCGQAVAAEEEHRLFRATVDYWRHWISGSTYTGRWREMVHRSALVLKLLTYAPTGAIVAAPTTSLPEEMGGVRNWDYRFTWLRDAAFTLYGLLRIGLTEEAGAFMGWLEQRAREPNPDGSLQIVYGIDGQHDLTEEELPHLEGYAGSRPVRIGNGAHEQLQLDVYGELLDSVYLYNKYGQAISYDLWVHLRRLVDWVADNWRRPDAGIWEVRSDYRHFVYSKLMCWVALDRGLRLADKRSFPADRQRWVTERDRIYEEIMEQGWSEERQAFVQHYGSTTLDASNLIMPLVFFMAPNDPRMLSTLDTTTRSPKEGGLLSSGLVYRYNLDETVDGLAGEEGTFNICTFWLVEALTRAGRTEPAKLERARLLFEQMLGYANHLGLYAEEIGPTGEALGNFPQAFTHLSLISAAFNLDRALGALD